MESSFALLLKSTFLFVECSTELNFHLFTTKKWNNPQKENNPYNISDLWALSSFLWNFV